VNSWGKVFTLALVAAFRMAGSSALAQQEGSAITAVVNVSAGTCSRQPGRRKLDFLQRRLHRAALQ